MIVAASQSLFAREDLSHARQQAAAPSADPGHAQRADPRRTTDRPVRLLRRGRANSGILARRRARDRVRRPHELGLLNYPRGRARDPLPPPPVERSLRRRDGPVLPGAVPPAPPGSPRSPYAQPLG